MTAIFSSPNFFLFLPLKDVKPYSSLTEHSNYHARKHSKITKPYLSVEMRPITEHVHLVFFQLAALQG